MQTHPKKPTPSRSATPTAKPAPAKAPAIQRSKYKTRRRLTKTRGVAIDFEYWYEGERYRPTLGYDLTDDQIDKAAAEIVLKIQAGEVVQEESAPLGGLTIAQFKPAYLKELRERNVTDLKRAEQVIDTYLTVQFPMPLREIRYSHGQDFISARRAATPQPSDGTIAREWAILNSLLNFAARVGEMDANPLIGVTAPVAAARNRMPEPDEFAAIAQVASERLRHAACVAMNTGLRAEKVWMIRPNMLVRKADGHWLILPPPRTKKKGNPLQVPLNRHAYAALTNGIEIEPQTRVFAAWGTPGVLSKAWARAAEDAACGDLRYHDLRRWFSSTLEDLGAEDGEDAVHRETVKHLMGHQASDVLEKHYLVRSKGWAKKLRAAVDQLAARYDTFIQSGAQSKPADS